MRSLDQQKTRATVHRKAPVAQRTEQRFPKTIQAVSTGRDSVKHAASATNSLQIGTSSASSCAHVDLSDEYSGKRLAPLWVLAKQTGNQVLRRLVLQYEVEVEGVSIEGRRCG